jgi:hypothetical protein
LKYLRIFNGLKEYFDFEFSKDDIEGAFNSEQLGESQTLLVRSKLIDSVGASILKAVDER